MSPAMLPKDDAEWTAVQTSAAVLAESGDLLAMRGRRKENGEPVPQTADWRKHVQALVRAAKGALEAALATAGSGGGVRGV